MTLARKADHNSHNQPRPAGVVDCDHRATGGKTPQLKFLNYVILPSQLFQFGTQRATAGRVQRCASDFPIRSAGCMDCVHTIDRARDERTSRLLARECNRRHRYQYCYRCDHQRDVRVMPRLVCGAIGLFGGRLRDLLVHLFGRACGHGGVSAVALCGGVASWANQAGMSSRCLGIGAAHVFRQPEQSVARRAPQTNSEQLFGHCGLRKQPLASRRSQTARNATRSCLSGASASPMRVSRTQSSAKFSTTNSRRAA